MNSVMIPGKHQPNILTSKLPINSACLDSFYSLAISLIIKSKHHKHKAALFSLSPENSPNKDKRTLTNKWKSSGDTMVSVNRNKQK